MFYECEDSIIENYVNDTNLYAPASDIDAVMHELQIIATKLFIWFDNNHMKADLEKNNLFLKLLDSEKKPGATLIESNSNKKLLETKIDSDLTFDE